VVTTDGTAGKPVLSVGHKGDKVRLLLVGIERVLARPHFIQHPAVRVVLALVQLAAGLLHGGSNQRRQGGSELGTECGLGFKLGNDDDSR
jgi:hypothetical protein